MSLEAFLSEWVWPGPFRSIGVPFQSQYSSYDAVDRLASLISGGAAPVYLSVNPYSRAGEVEALDRILYDFDYEGKTRLAWRDAQAFNEALAMHYDVGAVTTFSGKKGYHVYVWLREPVEGPPRHIKALYKELRGLFIKGAGYPTLDAQASDATRLARVPFSRHQDTGELCVPVDPELRPYRPGPGFSHALREHGVGPELVEVAERRVIRDLSPGGKHHDREYRGPKGRLRPCIEAVLNVKSVHDGPHLMRVAAVAELSAEGYGVEDIVGRFSGMEGFDERRTRYYVEHALRRGYRPYRCATIRDLGGCLGPECPLYKEDS